MTDFEREDMELKSIMGDKFTDYTKGETVAKPTKAPKTVKVKTSNKPVDAEWHPVETKKDSLKKCVKWAGIFGGLNMLIFYWQIAGLMAESVAIPCMWVCCALAGYGVGLNVWRAAK